MLKRQKAVTLIEMTIVLLIMGIIVAAGSISIPSMNSMNLDADARKIVSDLWLVREVAATSHTDYCIRFNRNSYTIYKNNCGGLGSDFFKQESLTSTVNASTVPFDLMWYGFNSLPFRLGGMAFSPASFSNQLTMVLSLNGHFQTIQTYELTGYVKLEKGCSKIWSSWSACPVTTCGQTGTQTRTCISLVSGCAGGCSGASSQSCTGMGCPTGQRCIGPPAAMVCQPWCGNGICDTDWGESYNNCCQDCGCWYPDTCTNGTCQNTNCQPGSCCCNMVTSYTHQPPYDCDAYLSLSCTPTSCPDNGSDHGSWGYGGTLGCYKFVTNHFDAFCNCSWVPQGGCGAGLCSGSPTKRSNVCTCNPPGCGGRGSCVGPGAEGDQKCAVDATCP